MFFKIFFHKKKIREKRKYPRKHTRNLIALGEARPKLLNLVNISEGGVQFISPEMLGRSEILKLAINLAEENTQIQALGRVVWSKQLSSRQKSIYRVGVCFLSLSQEVSRVIQRYVFSAVRI